jgi:hypothetical protein
MAESGIATKNGTSGLSLEQIRKTCGEIAAAGRGDTNKIASLISEMSLRYYQDVLQQAQQSFRWALAAAAVGVAFFVYAAVLFMQHEADGARLSVISGALVQVISGINFYLYGRASRQFASFHVCLERTNRFLLTNTVCDNLSDAKKDEMRSELIRVMANAPMLTVDGVPAADIAASTPPPAAPASQ